MKELIEIQSNLKAKKNQFNSFGNYKYRSCEDILESVKPLLKANNCTLIVSDEIINVGIHNYIKATAVIANSSGEIASSAGIAREAEAQKGMNPSQITGSTSSYARKYALNGLFAIDDAKDDDTRPVKSTDDNSDRIALIKKAERAYNSIKEPSAELTAWFKGINTKTDRQIVLGLNKIQKILAKG